MKAQIKRGIAAAAALVAALAVAVVGLPSSSSAMSTGLRAYGITSNGKQLLTFTTDQPDVLDWVRNVTGLSGDTFLIGIDFRVQDGQMYGVGNYGGVYTISIPGAVVTKVSQLSVALYGYTFGVDFNPAANRLRVISDTGQNLRHNIDDGATAGTTEEDTNLSTPPTGGTTKGVTAAAYTNNDLNATTATTLFDLNTSTDQVVIQSPANNGTLAPTGLLGVDAAADAGFDIYSDLTGGKTTSVSAFATLTPPSGTAALYSVNLFTGAVTLVGEFPLLVGDLAIALDVS